MRWLPAGLFAVLLAPPTPSFTADPPKPPTIDELASDLGDPVFSVREKAQRELWKRGEEAIPALERAAKGDAVESAHEKGRRNTAAPFEFGWPVRHLNRRATGRYSC